MPFCPRRVLLGLTYPGANEKVAIEFERLPAPADGR